MEKNFEIQKEIYNTQWNNIRHHWEYTVASNRFLSTIIFSSILPLKLAEWHLSEQGNLYDFITFVTVKLIAILFIVFLGWNAHKTQENHYERSQQARKVVVNIEKEWGLYDDHNKFIYQDEQTDFAYAKFAGGENRISHNDIQSSFVKIIVRGGVSILAVDLLIMLIMFCVEK